MQVSTQASEEHFISVVDYLLIVVAVNSIRNHILWSLTFTLLSDSACEY
jgi:hypothetical protein